MIGRYVTLAEVEALDPDHPRSDKFNVRAMCPLCGQGKKVCKDNRDFSYNAQNGRWRCFACRDKGTLREFWTEKEWTLDYKSGVPVSFKAKSAQALAEFNGTGTVPTEYRRPASKFEEQVPLPKESSVPSTTWAQVAESFNNHLVRLTEPDAAPGAAYLRNKRGIDVEFAQKCGVRFAPSYFGKPAIMFPIRREDGTNCAVQGRFLASNVKPKALTRGPLEGVFSTPGALDPGAVIVIVEGPLDAITLALAGVPSIAICGSSSVPAWLVKRCALSTVFAAFDNDKCTELHPRGAGNHAAEFLAGKLASVGGIVKRLEPPKRENHEKTDWNDILVDRGVDGLRAALKPILAMIARQSEPVRPVAIVTEDPKPQPVDTEAELLALGAELDADLSRTEQQLIADRAADLGLIESAVDVVQTVEPEPVHVDRDSTSWARVLLAGIQAQELAHWQRSIGDDAYIEAYRVVRSLAQQNALPMPTDTNPCLLRRGESVPDPSRFVRLTDERMERMNRDMERVYNSATLDRLGDELAVSALNLDTVVMWCMANLPVPNGTFAPAQNDASAHGQNIP